MAYLAAANVLNGLAAMQYLSFAKKPVIRAEQKIAKDKLV